MAIPAFYKQQEETTKDKRSFRFLLGYLRQYRRYFGDVYKRQVAGSGTVVAPKPNPTPTTPVEPRR